MKMSKQETSKGLGIASMVIGLVGLFISWIPYVGLPFCVIGLTLGLLQKDWMKNGVAITGVVLNGIFFLLQGVWIFFTLVGLFAGV